MFIVIDRYDMGQAVRGLAEVSNSLIEDPRPSYIPSGGWRLRQDLHDWLTQHGVEYKFHWMRERQSVWEVEIINAEEHANEVMLFLLKYGINGRIAQW